MSLRPGANPATAGIPLVIMSARRELREVAQAMHADLALPMVRERLHLLAHSPYEDEAVRHAAQQRLGSSPPQD